MTAADERVVEIMAEAMSRVNNNGWSGLLPREKSRMRSDAAEVLQSLRAAGAEVVLWRLLQKSDIPLPLDVETHGFPFGAIQYKDMTHWTILKGPSQ